MMNIIIYNLELFKEVEFEEFLINYIELVKVVR